MRYTIIILTFGFGLSTKGQTPKTVQFYGETYENCAGNIKPDPSLYWYGIYSTDSGEFSKAINVTSLEKSEREKLYNINNQTDINGNPLFYVGFTKQVQEKRVSFMGPEFYKTSGHNLYPGEIHWLYISGQGTSHSFQLFTTGNVKDYDYCPIIENYQLTLTNSNLKKQSLRQEIYADIRVEGCQMATLKWFGDVDADDKVDFIISTSTHEVRKHYLFLSSLASENNYVGQPISFSVGSCY